MKDSVKQLNYLIANGMKEGVHVILQNNLSEIHLHDEKHIKRNHVWMYEENMIKRIYEVSGNEYVPPKQTTPIITPFKVTISRLKDSSKISTLCQPNPRCTGTIQ